MNHQTLIPILLALALLTACHSSSSSGGDDDADTGSDSDTDTDVDTDTDTAGDDCPHECTSEELCDEVDGTVHDDFDCFFDEEVCCEWGSDTDTVVDTDSCTMGDFVGTVSVYSMADIEEAAGYTTIVGDLSIMNCPMCYELVALSCLAEVNGAVTISGVDALPDVDGLDALATVGGDLAIYDNSSLTNLDGLGVLTDVGGEFLSISNNVLLPDCEVCQVLDQLTSLVFTETDFLGNLDDTCTPVPDNCP